MILTVTLNPAIDHTLSLSEPLVDGDVARTGEYELNSGGKGINVSQYLRHLGVETTTTGLLGGTTGEFIRNELDEDGIAHDFVEVAERTRLNTTISAPNAEYKINHHGPTVDESVIDELIDVISGYDPEVVVIGGSLPPGLDVDAIDRLAEGGPWDTVVDVGGESLAELDAQYSLCKPNEAELEAATGMSCETIAECREAAQALREQGFDRVVASLGAKGALYVAEDTVLFAESLDVDVADTVGAGDALLSGVLAALHTGESPERVLSYGVAVSARLVETVGTAVDHLDDVPELADGVRIVEEPN